MRLRSTLLLLCLALFSPARSIEAGKLTDTCRAAVTCAGRHPFRTSITLAAAALVGGCTVFEQAAIPPARVASSGYRSELLGRGHLKIVDLGNSLSTSFYAGTQVGSIERMRQKPRQGNWCLDTDPHNGIESEYERLATVDREFVNFATPRATVDGDPRLFQNTTLDKWLIKARDMSDQVTMVLSEKPFPNVIQLWLGSNNIDWVFEVRNYREVAPKGYDILSDPQGLAAKHRKEVPSLVAREYEAQLDRLIAVAERQRYPVAIVIFGIPNAASYFLGLDEAEKIHEVKPQEFAYLGSVYEHFESFRPPFRAGTLEVVSGINRELAALAARKNVESLRRKGARSLRIIYSDDLFKVDFSDIRLLNRIDGFHPSVTGQNALAEAAMKTLKDVLPFVRVRLP